jgi:tetratricopeptide (TPR) repeat protein
MGRPLFELGKLYYEKCDFDIAMEKFRLAAKAFYASQEYSEFLECYNYLLRMYAERREYDLVNETKEKLQDMVLKDGFELNAKTYYTLGICASFKKQDDMALEYFQKSLAISLASNNKEDMCYAITGLAITYMAKGRYSEALKEIYNLEVFFQVLDVPDIKLSSQILNGIILREMGRYEQALEVLMKCYDDVRAQKNLYMYLQLLYAKGVTYLKSGESNMARFYLQLAQRSADPENLRTLVDDIKENLETLGVHSQDEYDIVFDRTTNTVVEKRKGRIEFKNQFILLDLLHLFIKRPGQVFSKEEIVQSIWSQNYDPSVHDNKIYVTIKRLRKLVEPDYEQPKYIFRAKNGYYLNKAVRVFLSN